MSVKDAKVGDTLPERSVATGFHNWNRYAAVNFEFFPIHMDDEAGAAAGLVFSLGLV
jgi:acyl dehydratase